MEPNVPAPGTESPASEAPRELTPEEQVQAIYLQAAEAIHAGKAKQLVRSELVANGVDPAFADQVVNEVNEARRGAVRMNGLKNMGLGALWFVIGSAITFGTYAAASEGGSYTVAYGAIIVGGLQFLWGGWQAATA
jgi:hypothetical protein